MTQGNPIINTRLLFHSIPYEIAATPIAHIRVIRILFLKRAGFIFNAIKKQQGEM